MTIRRQKMKLEFIMVGGIPVPVAVEDEISTLIAKQREERLFDATEGKQEAGKFGIKNKRRDDK